MEKKHRLEYHFNQTGRIVTELSYVIPVIGWSIHFDMYSEVQEFEQLWTVYSITQVLRKEGDDLTPERTYYRVMLTNYDK